MRQSLWANRNSILFLSLTADILMDEGENAEARAIDEARMIAVVFMFDLSACSCTMRSRLMSQLIETTSFLSLR